MIFCAPCSVGASGRSPEKMGVRPDAPTIETIVPPTFYEITNLGNDINHQTDKQNRENPWNARKA